MDSALGAGCTTRSVVADLITHAAVAWLLARPLKLGGARPLFVTGALLPDLLSRVPGILFTGLAVMVPGVPEVLRLGWDPLHMPVGMVLSSLLLAQFFATGLRRPAFTALLAGQLLHLAADLLQSHLGVGYLLFFPVSHHHFEVGLVGSEDSVWVAPLLGTIAILDWWRGRSTEVSRDTGPRPLTGGRR